MLIILLLQEYFELYYLDTMELTQTLRILDVDYKMDEESITSEGFLGFFDWLRTDENTIVGVSEAFFFDIMNKYHNIFSKYPYVKTPFGEGYIEILFKGDWFINKLSGDSDWMNSYVYESDNKNHLFTFPLGHLNPKELQSLLGYCETLDKNIALVH